MDTESARLVLINMYAYLPSEINDACIFCWSLFWSWMPLLWPTKKSRKCIASDGRYVRDLISPASRVFKQFFAVCGLAVACTAYTSKEIGHVHRFSGFLPIKTMLKQTQKICEKMCFQKHLIFDLTPIYLFLILQLRSTHILGYVS